MEDAKIRVVLVDDSPFIRRAVERMLEPLPQVEVVGVAADGGEAVDQVQRLRPDVVILDIVMPEVDGLEAIERIMRVAPTPILVLSTQTRPGAEVTLRALELGAVDFVSKSQAGTRMDIYDLAPVLRERILAMAASRAPAALRPPDPGRRQDRADRLSAAAAYDLLVIGASTGGPRAITAVLSELPANFPAGIVVAQHMPPGFTGPLAERLDRRCQIRVREAEDGMPIEPGVALLGVGGRHVRVERSTDGLIARVPEGTDGLIHRPSVNLLFRSAVEAVGGGVVGLILTGMGQDGATGLAAIRRAGGRTVIESEETAVIYGMPRAAREWAEQELPLDRIPAAITDLFGAEAD